MNSTHKERQLWENIHTLGVYLSRDEPRFLNEASTREVRG